ncbi:hypothetical protein IFR04_015473 [Cadophora malorum]|uniref:WSC domain-containing protein n=1 Tax=Cadophora malorum TaxID=108018 RepID=A0A8H7VZF3_9HELO|nr:hypothetical protein IFR04_015473 [Cadophora malorum]
MALLRFQTFIAALALLSPFMQIFALEIPTLPGSWTYQGCYTEIGRTLNGASYTNTTTMTDESCINYCSERGFIYAGTQYSSQCFCGSSIAPGAAISATPSDCNLPCSGNQTQPCGGVNRLTLFWSGVSGPQTNPGAGNWSIVGCYTEGITGRVLPNGVPTTGGPGAMTVDLCTAACQNGNYLLAGVEYSQQCWCGNSFANGGTLAPTTPDGLSGCNMLCAGNLSEYCGGGNRLNVYNFNNAIATITASAPAPTGTGPAIKPTIGPYSYYGCQTEGTTARALAGAAMASDSMTLEMCQAFCAAGNFALFGVEYGRECYCANVFSAGSVAANDTECSFTCPGNIYEYCGAGNRLSVYQRT